MSPHARLQLVSVPPRLEVLVSTFPRRERVLAALRGMSRIGALRDRAWELSVPYSTLRRWVSRDPTLRERLRRTRETRSRARVSSRSVMEFPEGAPVRTREPVRPTRLER